MLNPLDNVVHVIQTALTPAFLLAGLAALLSVFASRLDRVTRQVDRIASNAGAAADAGSEHDRRRLACLRQRTHFLDAAVVFGALAGGLTCLAALVLFVGGLRDVGLAASVLLWTFGLALALTICAIAAFLAEMLLASRSLRADVILRHTEADSASKGARHQRLVSQRKSASQNCLQRPVSGSHSGARSDVVVVPGTNPQ
jgi:hypothetical protein